MAQSKTKKSITWSIAFWLADPLQQIYKLRDEISEKKLWQHFHIRTMCVNRAKSHLLTSSSVCKSRLCLWDQRVMYSGYSEHITQFAFLHKHSTPLTVNGGLTSPPHLPFASSAARWMAARRLLGLGLLPLWWDLMGFKIRGRWVVLDTRYSARSWWDYWKSNEEETMTL